jgi:polysaccharide biosynthesis/export protein
MAHRQVRTLFEVGALGAMTDEQLLAIFTTRRDEELAEVAFAALVDRHGPMVLGVCRRILRNSHDSADAFQATFLVLARRAGVVRAGETLGPWLYGVSRRVAHQLRASAARRSSREVTGAELAEAASLDPAHDRERDRDRAELLAALDEEIARLPEKYRAAVVLCDLEGTKHDEAARRLRCPVGTVESRLSRGRTLLRARLSRRGLAPAGLVTDWIVSPDPATAAIPPTLAEATARLARQFAAGRAPAAASAAMTLTERTLRAMFMNRMKVGALGLLAAGALAAGVATLASSATPSPGRDEPEPPKGEALLEGGAPPGPGKPGPKLIPGKAGDVLRIELLEALPGRPLTGTRVVRPDGTISLGFYGDLYVDGLNRDQIKVKLLEHMRRWLTDETLGLFEVDGDGPNAKWKLVDPVDSNRVFVEDHLDPQGDQERRMERLQMSMDELLIAIRGLRRTIVAHPPAPNPQPEDDKPAQPEGKPETEIEGPPEPPPNLVPFPAPTRIQVPGSAPAQAPAPAREPAAPSSIAAPAGPGAANEERLRAMERKLDQILERIDGGRSGHRD